MKVLRSTLFVAAAVVTAACGDKVNLTQATPPTPAVHSVAVAPTTATLNIGQAITMSAAVTADAGATVTPIAWTSSDPSKVSVSGTTTSATVTGVAATPGVAVCAAVGGATGCATVVVAGASAPIPATVSILSITLNGNINASVNPAAVAGTIDIRANVSPGNQTVSKVVAVVGGIRADSQTFSAAQSAALRSAADQAIAEQSAFPPILFSINTAKFNAVTGIPVWLNVAQIVSVQLYVGTTLTSTATYNTPLTFANANTFVQTTVVSGGKAANSAAGYAYVSGSMAVSVLPVVYTPGITMATGTVTFGTPGCDAVGPRTQPLVAPVAPSNAWTATFTTATGAGSAADFKSYEFRTATLACAAVIGTGETFTVSAISNGGNNFLAAVVPANFGTNSFRVDNVAPDQGVLANAPLFCANTNFRENGWINAAVVLNGANTTCGAAGTSDKWLIAGPTVDLGVGGYTLMLRTGAGTTLAAALAATASATPVLPAPSLTNNSYCAIVTATDLLGNETKLPAAGACTPATAGPPGGGVATASNNVLFGVDIAPPTIAFSGGLAANARINTGTVAAEFQVTVSDTGVVGNSGMQDASSVLGTVQIKNAAGTTCFVGTVVATVCTPASVNAAPAFPLVPTTVVAASATTGYYFYSAVSRDAAGNSSSLNNPAGVVTKVVAFDPAANVPSLTTSLFNVPLTGSSVVFNANGADNFDLWKVSFNMTYAGGLVGPIVYPSFSINTFPVASAGPSAVTLINSNVPISLVLNGFMRQVENETSACNAPLAVGGQFKPTQLQEALLDQANNSSGPVNTAIPAASVTTGVSYAAATAPLLTQTFIVSNGVTGCNTAAQVNAAVLVSTGIGPAAAVNALSLTLTADIWGPTATFNPPFTRVDFYAVVGANLEQIATSTLTSTVDNGAGQGRRHRYSVTWTPGTASPISGTAWGAGAFSTVYPIYAVGVNANGDALVSAVNGNITLTNP